MLPPNGPSKSDATRATILAATVEILGRYGAHAVKLEAVAEAANVSTGVIYYHFDGRKELVRAALTEALQGHRMPYETPAEHLPPTDRLIASLGQYLGMGDETATNDRIYAEGMRVAVFSPEMRPALATLTTLWEDATAELVAAAVPAGDELASLPIAKALTALVDGLQQRVRSGLVPRRHSHDLLAGAVDAATRARNVDGQ